DSGAYTQVENTSVRESESDQKRPAPGTIHLACRLWWRVAVILGSHSHPSQTDSTLNSVLFDAGGSFRADCSTRAYACRLTRRALNDVALIRRTTENTEI